MDNYSEILKEILAGIKSSKAMDDIFIEQLTDRELAKTLSDYKAEFEEIERTWNNLNELAENLDPELVDRVLSSMGEELKVLGLALVKPEGSVQ